MDTYRPRTRQHAHYRTSEIVLLGIAAVAGTSIVFLTATGAGGFYAQLFAGAVFTLSLVGFIRLRLDPDIISARQSDDLLRLASATLACMQNGMTPEAAQRICELLLPATKAIAVAITDRETILGYAGYAAASNPPGAPIRTSATHEVIAEGKERVLYSYDEIGLTGSSARINAAIIEPLFMGNTIYGTMKFYYRRASQINEVQLALAHGLAELLSTQMAATALEEQTKLATSMELKALQAQINPHFLFNTINTIASLIRTDPAKARELLREFAVFYRSTLEDSNDLIVLDRELKQVERYFSFETARFGEERLSLEIDVDPQVREMLVPSFMIQPLVENSVHHAMKSEGKLTISIKGTTCDGKVILSVTDDGAGMSEEKLRTMMDPESSQGLGIAVKNVRDRMRSYFGPGASMDVTSELGQGTTVTFTLDESVIGQLVHTSGMQELASDV